MYAVINIKLDIVFAVGKLSQYIINPARHHEQIIKYLIQYLRLIIKHCLTYKASGNN